MKYRAIDEMNQLLTDTNDLRHAKEMHYEFGGVFLDMDLYREVKAIMAKNYDDYHAEEYDTRFNYTKFNKAVDYIHDGAMMEIDDFSAMCAYVRCVG
mgnify:CR=1 FL=1